MTAPDAPLDLDATNATPNVAAGTSINSTGFAAMTAEEEFSPQLGLHFVRRANGFHGNRYL